MAQWLVLGAQHVALLEERRVAIGQLEQIGGQLVGAIVGHGQVEGLGEAEQFQGQRPFGRRGQQDGRAGARSALTIDVALGEDAPHPGVGVLHVRGRVAVHGQHLVVAEDVIAGAVLREVGVLQGGDAHASRRFRRAVRAKVPGRRAWRRRWPRRSPTRGGRLRPAGLPGRRYRRSGF